MYIVLVPGLVLDIVLILELYIVLVWTLVYKIGKTRQRPRLRGELFSHCCFRLFLLPGLHTRGGGEEANNNNKFDDTNSKVESSSDKVVGSLPAAGLTREEGQGVTPIPDPPTGLDINPPSSSNSHLLTEH